MRLHDLYDRLFRASRRLTWFPPLVARLTLGTVFLQTGWGKLHHLAGVTQYFTSLGIPAPHAQAVFVSALEFVGGGLLVLGLGTRFIAVPLTVVMGVALATAKAASLTGPSDVLRQLEYLFIVLFVFLIIDGAGALSVDALIARRLTRGRERQGASPAHPEAEPAA